MKKLIRKIRLYIKGIETWDAKTSEALEITPDASEDISAPIRPNPIKVVPLKPYKALKVKVWFSDGKIGIYDMTPYVSTPLFRSLKRKHVFKRVHIVDGFTIGWGKDQDICPDDLYYLSHKVCL